MQDQNSIFSLLRRAFELLSQQERKISFALLILIFANSIVEILGLAMLVPVIGMVIEPEVIHSNQFFAQAFHQSNQFGITTSNHFLILLSGLMVCAFIFKALFGLTVTFFQTRFSFSVAHRISGYVWSHHFSQSLEKMRKQNTGRILSEINNWPLTLASGFLSSGFLIVTEITVITLISLGLLFYNPLVMLSVSLLLGLGTLIIRTLTKNRLEHFAQVKLELEPKAGNIISNAVKGFLEIVTFQAVDSAKQAYLKDRKTIFQMNSIMSVLHQAPAKLYEVLAVSAVACSIVTILLVQTENDRFLEMLTLMAVSAYRIMPSMSRINGCIMQIRSQSYILPSLERSHQTALKKTKNKTESDLTLDSNDFSIQLNNVTLSYQDGAKPILQDFNHAFHPGAIHGIIGPSGSGKSTLTSAILGLHKPWRGELVIRNDGKALELYRDVGISEWLRHIGYVSQKPFLFEGTVYENLTLKDSSNFDKSAILTLIKRLGLEECLGPSPLQFHLQEGGMNLSGGQQQRLALLRIFMHNFPILLLDEATSAVDTELRNIIFEMLREKANNGCLVILITHDLKLAQMCDLSLNLSLVRPFAGDVPD